MDTGSAVFGMDPLLPDTGEPLRISPLNRRTGKSVRMPYSNGGFMGGVQSAVAELNEQTVGMDMEQKIKRIHDYICQRVTYRNDNTLWVHSAASLFLDADPAFVCEGYAKSMKFSAIIWE